MRSQNCFAFLSARDKKHFSLSAFIESLQCYFGSPSDQFRWLLSWSPWAIFKFQTKFCPKVLWYVLRVQDELSNGVRPIFDWLQKVLISHSELIGLTDNKVFLIHWIEMYSDSQKFGTQAPSHVFHVDRNLNTTKGIIFHASCFDRTGRLDVWMTTCDLKNRSIFCTKPNEIGCLDILV